MRYLHCAVAFVAVAAGVVAARPGESAASVGGPRATVAGNRSASIPPRPLRFVENSGRFGGDVRFAVEGRDRAAWIGDRSMSFALRDGRSRATVEIAFDGARDVRPRGASPTPSTLHWFGGRDGARSPVHGRTFSSVACDAPWPGIDLVLDARGGGVEYSLVVAPGADARVARFVVRGAQSVRTTASGELVAATSAGPLAQSRPVAWQAAGGTRVPVEVAFDVGVRRDDGTWTYGFALGAHDAARAVTIDPTITIDTLPFGGSAEDVVSSVVFDRLGNLYACGWTYSTDLIPPGTAGLDTSDDGTVTAFLAKFDPAGGLVFASYLGSTSSASDLGVDATGSCVLAGVTSDSAHFPVKGGPILTPSTLQFGDYFAARFAADGASLVYSGFIGETDGGYVTDVRVGVNSGGAACVTGTATGSWSPITTTLGKADAHRGAIAVGIGADGHMLYSVSLNATGIQQVARDVAVDDAGAAYVTGYGLEGNLPPAIVSSLRPGDGYGFGFVAKINAAGTGLDYAAFVNGYAYGIDVDAEGRAYVTGQGSPAVVVGPPLPAVTSRDPAGYIARISADGTHFEYAGPIDMITPRYVAVGADRAAFVTGEVTAENARVVRVDPSGASADTVAALPFPSPRAIAVDPSGNIAAESYDPFTSNEGTLSRITGVVQAIPGPDSVTATALSAHSVRVGWTESAPVTGFIVERAGATGPFAVIAADVPATTFSFEDAGLAANTTYRYRVTAQRDSAFSAPSAPVAVRTAATVTLHVLRGRIVDAQRPSHDTVGVTARVGFLPGAAHQTFDPAVDALRVAIGAAPAFALDVPAADPAWKVRRNTATWHGKLGAGGTARVTVDFVRNRLVLRAAGLTIAALPGNPVTTSVAFGPQAVSETSAWRVAGRVRVAVP